MRRYLLSLAVGLLCLVCLTACHDEENDNSGTYKPPVTASRTVLIYMASENDLAREGFLRSDLREIVEGSEFLGNDQRLFVFVDSLGTGRMPYIMEVHGGKTYMRHEYDHEFYSCSPVYFHEIIQKVVSMAPADSYGLVLWGHASGWTVSTDTIASSRTRAYGQDDGDDGSKKERKWMNITQMAKALEGLPKMEFIFADCCNMMCAEVGYELRNATNYLIGSPAEMPGEGAPYDYLIPHFYKNDSELYRSIIDEYYDYYLDAYQDNYYGLRGHSVPLSVIDTRYIEVLAEQTHNVLDKFTNGYPQYPDYPDVITDSIAYYWYSNEPIMFDMRAFIKANVSDDVFQQWDKSYQLAVPYYRMSLQWMTGDYRLDREFLSFSQDTSRYGCVSMFIPIPAYDNSTYKHNKTYNNYGWNRLIDWSRFGWQ